MTLCDRARVVGEEDTRSFVISEARINPAKHTKNFYTGVRNAMWAEGGLLRLALFYYLFDWKKTGFTAKGTPPVTDALRRQERLSLGGVASWLDVCLRTGTIDDQAWPERIANIALHQAYAAADGRGMTLRAFLARFSRQRPSGWQKRAV